jgi:hypothetical protein
MSITQGYQTAIKDFISKAINSLQQAEALFAWLISYQPAVLFSQNKPTTSNQPAVLFSQNKPAPAISHQPTEQAVKLKTAIKGHT